MKDVKDFDGQRTVGLWKVLGLLFGEGGELGHFMGSLWGQGWKRISP